MSKLTRKFVAVLMLLWLPLSGASALAATVSMQSQHGDSHEASMQQMHHADAGDCHDEMPAAQDHGASGGHDSCNSCGVCHLACSGYLAAPAVASPAMQASGQSATPYLVIFDSVTSVPLLHPPLARA